VPPATTPIRPELFFLISMTEATSRQTEEAKLICRAAYGKPRHSHLTSDASATPRLGSRNSAAMTYPARNHYAVPAPKGRHRHGD
jgi:hypothetical protein